MKVRYPKVGEIWFEQYENGNYGWGVVKKDEFDPITLLYDGEFYVSNSEYFFSYEDCPIQSSCWKEKYLAGNLTYIGVL